jgi:tetratricopeptide (TPR) repeat protein
MNGKREFPERHEHSTLEAISETFFRNHLPPSWIVDKPVDFGIDLNVTPVINGNVVGLNFSVQLKAQNDTKGKLETRLKKTTLNYLFNRLEPIMIVLYDKKANQAYWKWLIQDDFDLTKNVLTYSVQFSKGQTLSIIDWQTVCDYVQRIFKVKNRLLTSLEFDLFNTDSEPEIKAWAHFVNHNYQEAVLYFRRLIQHPSPKPIWLLALAQSEYQIYDYTNAFIDINKVLDVDKDDNILLTKGCILAEDGIRHNDVHKLREAEKVFEDLYQRSPSATHEII